MTAEKVYALADETINLLNKKAIRRFNTCKKKILLKIDELNVFNCCTALYENLYNDAVSAYTELAEMVYEDSLLVKKKKDEEEDAEYWLAWLMENVLDVPDEVTKYIFTKEVDRKRDRTIEAVNASSDKSTELNKALRYFTLQTTQYADNITDKVRIKAFTDSGVKKVVWHTMMDSRVCNDCEPLDGQVFDIDKVPPKQHYRCRCWVSDYDDKDRRTNKEKS